MFASSDETERLNDLDKRNAWFHCRKVTTSSANGLVPETQFSANKNRVMFSTARAGCLAYHNDETHQILRYVAGKHDLNCRDKVGAYTSFAVASSAVATTGIPELQNIPRDRNDPLSTELTQWLKEGVPRLRELVNTYVRIPWLLLNPDPAAKEFAKIKKPSARTRVIVTDSLGYAFPYDNFPEPELRIGLPGSVWYHPGLYWFVNALIREAASLGCAPGVRRKEQAEEILESVQGFDVAKIIDEHDYSKALDVWYAMRPHIMTQAQENSTDQTAWHSPALWNMAVQCSITAFENIILKGGWIATGPSLRKNWRLEYAIKSEDHAGTAIAWEPLVRLHGGKKCPKDRPDLRTKIEEIHNNFNTRLEAASWA
ncbi:MAG: hypothetical protein KOO63_09370 [Bacteroidales bacterium]|nr:hypothetical protein [Candidatus Latescibacterota bacterium]